MIEMTKMEKDMGPVLPPFEFASPMELWTRDAKDGEGDRLIEMTKQWQQRDEEDG